MTNRQILQAMSGLMAGMFVAILAGTVVANALPRIITDLGASQSSYTWVVTSELLAMTATVPLWGKLSDLYNKKLLLQLSLGMFVVGSLLAGFSQGVELLIFSRVVQGIGAGGLTALAQVVMAAVIPPRRLGRYAGIFGAVFAVGTVAGPLIGGVLVDTSWLGWRWCFFIGVPFALLAIVLLQRTLRLPTVRREVRIDFLGAFLIVAGVCALLIWTSLAGNRFDWLSWQTAALTGGGVVLLVAAVRVESRVPEPVIPLDIFRNRTVTLTTVASLLVGVAMFGGTVFLSQYFQISLGKSPTVAGLMSLPMILGLLVSSTVAGQVISATGRWKAYLVAGAVVMTAGLGLLSTIDSGTGFGLLSLYMAVLGVGVGMLMQNLVLAAQNDVPAAELGAATSVLSFFRSMGGTIGTSVLGAILANRVATEMTRGMEEAGIPADGARAPGGAEGGVPDITALPAPVRAIVEHAYGVATADLFLIATPFALLALVAVVFIKEKPLKTTSGMERLAEEDGGTGARGRDVPEQRPAAGAPEAGGETGREPAAPVG
ncbi:MDR family MFS transporter [Streptomyces radiopugnans]|uniref:Drug resistance transporter, EmrB/QacA subfamily n=1 Tax=Streptomyces radiopugnans TaxID=403935 RepID=A0A1H9JRG4_9ACTN|nr:MDR family MFS transporter [Streptomyces radiopugnans]SEQ89420.1 drug resistance transporter, EmrB/QacA subfamily [Streptomyces radiopugnans]